MIGYAKHKNGGVRVNILTSVVAGSLESSDVLISLAPSKSGELELQVESIVIKQFGRRIHAIAEEMLRQQSVQGGMIRIQDRGALECTLRARLETALARVQLG